MYTKSVPKSVTLKLKSKIFIHLFIENVPQQLTKSFLFFIDGGAVDPESGLDDVTHIFTQGKTKWFAILNKIDIQKDKNSYYKLQLLESDNHKK